MTHFSSPSICSEVSYKHLSTCVMTDINENVMNGIKIETYISIPCDKEVLLKNSIF